MVSKRAFTVIELLVVIIVIAILVTLSIVGYSNISFKATISSIQSDLANSKKQLLAFQAQISTNSFPTAINCVNPGSTEICIRPSGSSTTFSYAVNNSAAPPNFNLTATNGTIKYWINNGSNSLTTPDLVSSGLIFYVDAGNPSSYIGSGSTINDLSGNLLNTTLMNGVGYDSSNGGSLVFDRVNDYAITSNTTISGSQTFSAWAVATGTPDSPAGIITQHDHGSTANFGINYVSGNKIAPSIGYTDSTREYNSKVTNYTVSLNTIFNVALVYDSISNSIFFYINGLLDSSYVLTKTPKYTNWPLCLGRWNPGYNGYYFAGRIFTGSVYNRALSPSEITQNFNALRGRYGI